MRCNRAFTLIELLVVVTIIVVLLALLVPAMDQAIYQAELAVCGANLHSIATGAQSYALNNARRYPARPSIDVSRERPICIKSTYLDPALPDDRHYIKEYININGHLNDPLTENIELENTHPNSAVFSPYALWFGVRYRVDNHEVEKGMYKLGDAFTWEGDRYNILAADWDGVYTDTDPPHHINTHPDREGLMWEWVLQDSDMTNTGTQTPQLQATWSYWHSTNGVSRGTVDNNYAMDDGSIRRFDRVGSEEGRPDHPTNTGRFVWLPQSQSYGQPTWQVQLPRIQ